MWYTASAVDLLQRLDAHLKRMIKNSFSARYNCTELVYYELFGSVNEAYAREKQIKGWTRAKKIALIKTINPAMLDLMDRLRGIL